MIQDKCVLKLKYSNEVYCYGCHSYFIILPVPPKPPAIRVHRVTSDSITLRWTNSNIGHSPIISYRIKYKITYGDWTEKMVSCQLILQIMKA